MSPTPTARNSFGPLLLVALGLLAACVAPTQPLTLDHPASPAAVEGLPPLEAGDGSEDSSVLRREGAAEDPAGAVTTQPPVEPTQQSASSVGPRLGATAHGGHGGHGPEAEKEEASGPSPDETATTDTPGDAGHADHTEESAAAAETHDHTSEPAMPSNSAVHRHGEARPDDSADSSTSDAGQDHGAAAPVGHTAADELSLFERALPGLAASANVHPAFVHFPIALWPAALLFWILALVRPRDALFATARWLSYLALVCSLVTTATGLMAEESLGHDSPGHDLVHVHKYFMLTTTGLGAVTAILAFVAGSRPARAWRWAWGTGLVLTVAVMTFGADQGGLLVYGHGVGTTTSATSAQSNAHEQGSAPSSGPSHGAHGHGGNP